MRFLLTNNRIITAQFDGNIEDVVEIFLNRFGRRSKLNGYLFLYRELPAFQFIWHEHPVFGWTSE